MFKRSQRYSFKKGLPSKYLSTNYFTMRYQKSQNGKFQTAVVVSKKIDKRSTVRHLLKRRFTHALKSIVQEIDIPYSIVFFLKKNVLNKSFNELEPTIKEELRRAKIIEI